VDPPLTAAGVLAGHCGRAECWGVPAPPAKKAPPLPSGPTIPQPLAPVETHREAPARTHAVTSRSWTHAHAHLHPHTHTRARAHPRTHAQARMYARTHTPTHQAHTAGVGLFAFLMQQHRRRPRSLARARLVHASRRHPACLVRKRPWRMSALTVRRGCRRRRQLCRAGTRPNGGRAQSCTTGQRVATQRNRGQRVATQRNRGQRGAARCDTPQSCGSGRSLCKHSAAAPAAPLCTQT
jgi:hypothetical protein